MTTPRMTGLALLALLLPSTALAVDAVVPPLVAKGVDPLVNLNLTSLVSSEADFLGIFETVTQLEEAPAGLTSACLSSTACLYKIAKASSADAVIAGQATPAGGEYQFKLIYYDVSKNRIVRTKSFNLPDSPADIADGMGGYVREVVTGEAPAQPESATLSGFDDVDLFEDDDFETVAPTSGSSRRIPTPGGGARELDDMDLDFLDSEDEDAARKAAAEEAARRRAEEDAARRAEEEAARRRAAEDEARQAREEEARRRAETEAEARRRAEAEEARRVEEAQARRRAEDEAAAAAAAAAAASATSDDDDDFDFEGFELSSSTTVVAANEPVADDDDDIGILDEPRSSSSSSSSSSRSSRSSYDDLDDDSSSRASSSRASSSRASSSRSSSSRYDDLDDDTSSSRSNSSRSNSSRSNDSDRSSRASSSRASDRQKIEHEASDSRVLLAGRLGFAPYQGLGFVTYGAEVGYLVTGGLAIAGGLEAYSVQRTIPPENLEPGESAKQWNTILPINIGLQYHIGQSTVRPYVGAEMLIVPGIVRGSTTPALGGRGRAGANFFVAESVALTLNGAIGFLGGKDMPSIADGMDEGAIAPQVSAGTVLFF